MKKLRKFCWSCCLLIWLTVSGCADQSPTPITPTPETNNPVETTEPQMSNNQPPNSVLEAVRQDASNRTGIEPSQVEITEASAQTWPDGCLGLAQADEFCTQALVEGWRVVATDGSQTWVYRTDGQGRAIRLEA